MKNAFDYLKTTALAGLLLLGVSLIAVGDDHDEARELYQAGEIQPLETIVEQAQAQRPGRVLEVELETEHDRYIYELEILDPQGVVWELEFDARTGELLDTGPER
jgi:uncharacterized membrane protein YkoI